MYTVHKLRMPFGSLKCPGRTKMKIVLVLILAVLFRASHQVQEPARAVSQSTTIEAVISQDLQIDCKAQGNSEAPELMIFIWTRNGQAIRIKAVGTDDKGHAMDQLTLENIMAIHAGIYECHPKNPIGEYNFTEFTVQVGFLEPPVINSANFSEMAPNGSFVAVCWDPVDTTEYPGLVIEHYVVELLLVTSQGTEVIESVLVSAAGWQNCTNVQVKIDEEGNRYGARVNAFGSGGIKLTSGTEYTSVTRHRTYTDEIWWVILLITIFALIALCSLFCIFFICCLFLCPTILDAGWRREREGVNLKEGDEKSPKKRPTTPDSVSSI